MEKKQRQYFFNVVVFDSGIGGLNLLYECARRVPSAHYLYLSDNKNVPYGNRSPEEILSLTLAALSNIKVACPSALVVACNTVTAHCIDELRRIFPFPVIGIQPAVKQAAAGGKCLVLATEATVKSSSFLSLVARYGNENTRVVPCRNLAEYVERNVTKLPPVLPEGLLPNEKADAIVLGCTHYTFVKEQIKNFYNCPVFDGIAGTADHFKQIVGTADHFLTLSGICDHFYEFHPKISFIGDNSTQNRRIYKYLFGKLQ